MGVAAAGVVGAYARKLEWCNAIQANEAEAGLPALTAIDRTKWAEIREEQFQVLPKPTSQPPAFKP